MSNLKRRINEHRIVRRKLDVLQLNLRKNAFGPRSVSYFACLMCRTYALPSMTRQPP